MNNSVNAGSPFKSVGELVRYAKSNPGKLSYGSGGSGASGHLAMELFKSVTGTDIVHIPYKGTGPAITDLIGGQIQTTIASAAPTLPQVKAGKLRALAVTSNKRSLALPDVPTIAESGFPAYEVTQWFGILGPAGMPKAVVQRINALCELNVVEQARNVCQTTVVQDAWQRGQEVVVHGWVYGLHNGLLEDLTMSVSAGDDLSQTYHQAIATVQARYPGR